MTVRVKTKVGDRYHSLTVVELVSRMRGNRKARYARCRCECGNETIVEPYKLRTGNTKGCGCLARRAPAKTAGSKVTVPPPDGSSRQRWRQLHKRTVLRWGDYELRRGEQPTPGGTLDDDPTVAAYLREHGVTRVVDRAG